MLSSRSGRFIPATTYLDTRQENVWGPRADLGVVEKRKVLVHPANTSQMF